jgi:glyoxylase-like metal-dependent hydrolase (beta-lactamase superfamily II)
MEPKEIASGVYYLSVRGSNVYFVRADESWTLIDAGWGNSGSLIRKAAESLFGQGTKPDCILLTHAHPDHVGSAVELARLWDVSVYVHPDELALACSDFSAINTYANPLDRWLVLPMIRLMGRRRRDAMLAKSSLKEVVHSFDPSAGVPGLPEWECIPTPGHTPGHVSYFRRQDRVLISGDAILTAALGGFLTGIQRISLPPSISSWDWRQTKESIVTLAKLEPRVLATGHGVPMAGAGLARDMYDFTSQCCGD